MSNKAMDYRSVLGSLSSKPVSKTSSGPPESSPPRSNEPTTLDEAPILPAEPVDLPAVGERQLRPTSGPHVTAVPSESIPPQFATMAPELLPDPEPEESGDTLSEYYDSDLPMTVVEDLTFDQIEEEALLYLDDTDPLHVRAFHDIKDYRERYQGKPTPIVDKLATVSPGQPKSNDTDDLACWFIDRLGLEAYAQGRFWSRFCSGLNWSDHALGSREGKKSYKLGYFFEEVPKEVIYGEFLRVNDLYPKLQTKKGETVKKILQPHVETTIINQMARRLNATAQRKSNFFASELKEGGSNEEFGFACLGSVKDPDHPVWVSVKGDLSQWKVEPLNPRMIRARWAIDCDVYGPNDNPEDPCPVFDKFLATSFAGNENPEESIQCFYEFFGATLLGLTHKYKRALYLYGETDTGKSVLAKTFEFIFPESARSEVTLSQMAAEDNDKHKAELLNKRVNIVTETKGVRRQGRNWKLLESATFKQAVSGESFTGRKLYSQLQKIVPRCGFVFCGNGKIPLADQGGAVMNRFSVLHFRNRVAKEDQDEMLPYKIKLEAGGIIYKALNAVLGLPASRLIDPTDSQALKKAWSELTSDTVTSWLNDRVEKTNWGQIGHGKLKGSTTKAAEVYRSYESYCQEQKESAISKKLFWDRLRDQGVDTKKKNDGHRANVVLKDRDN